MTLPATLPQGARVSTSLIPTAYLGERKQGTQMWGWPLSEAAQKVVLMR